MHYIEKNISHQKLHKPDNSGMTILKQLKKRKEKTKQNKTENSIPNENTFQKEKVDFFRKIKTENQMYTT